MKFIVLAQLGDIAARESIRSKMQFANLHTFITAILYQWRSRGGTEF